MKKCFVLYYLTSSISDQWYITTVHVFNIDSFTLNMERERRALEKRPIQYRISISGTSIRYTGMHIDFTSKQYDFGYI